MTSIQEGSSWDLRDKKLDELIKQLERFVFLFSNGLGLSKEAHDRCREEMKSLLRELVS